MIKKDLLLPSVAKHAALHSVFPIKSYGQNFLYDLSLCRKIVEVSKIDSNNSVIEIGSGVGGLTRAILEKKPKHLVAIEKDLRCLALLEEIKHSYSGSFYIKYADAIQISLKDLISEYGLKSKISIVANLPYNIGTVLLIKWLKSIEYIDSVTIMLQEEVVDRICASPSYSEYGRLSVLCSLICQTQKAFKVSSQAFFPKPKVQSAVVCLLPQTEQISSEILEKVEFVTNIAFRGRRKMLRSSFSRYIPNISAILEELNISSTIRPDELSPYDYLRIALLT